MKRMVGHLSSGHGIGMTQTHLHQQVKEGAEIGMRVICHKNTKEQFKQEWNFKKLILTKWVLGRNSINVYSICVRSAVHMRRSMIADLEVGAAIAVHSARDKLLGLYDL